MDREQAPHGAQLEQVAEAHQPDVFGVTADPVAGGTGDTQGRTPGGATRTPTSATRGSFGLPEPTVLTWQDLLDLSGQVLPSETVYHLRNAGREAMLAAYSLWRSIRKAASGPPENRVRKHIEVE